MGIDTNIENLETSFDAAKAALEKSWNSIDAWNHLEEFAESAGFDKRVADVYRNSLKLTFDSKTFELIAKRAVDFFDEWFGDSDDVKDLLKQIVEISQAGGHDGDWAFNRLTEMFFAAGEWDSVFNIYDSFLESTKDVDRKKQLLDEGANIARDMADLPEKALEYLLQLQELDRDNSSRLQTIERMLEKQERWDDLINLWNDQIPFMSGTQSVAARLNIADCYMSKLDKFDLAVTALEEILKISKSNEDAWSKLEYILSDENISSELRFKAMEILSNSYKATGNYSARVDVIKKAIDFINDDEVKTDLLRKVASSLALINREEESIEHYGELLKISPSDGDAVKQIKLLSIKEKRYDLRAEVLMNAGLATTDESLKIEHMGTAAQLFATELNDRKKAISIYSELLELTDIEPSLMLKTAHSLNDLLSLENDHEQRLNVLEKIAELEPAKIVRRTVLQEAAKLAVNLDIPEKALMFWNSLLDENENDIEALGAVISLHEQLEGWEDVIKFLLKRADSKILKEQRRSDLVKIAEIQINYLDDPEQAISTWHKVFNEFGPRKDVVEQLDQLLGSNAQFEDLAIILNKAVGGDFERLQQLNIRLGDIYIKLERPDAALEYYKKVINLNSNNELALKALTELSKDDSGTESVSKEAVQLLWECHKKNENWTALIEMLDDVLDLTDDLFNKTQMLKEAASVSENRLDDSELTFSILMNLISLTPDDPGVISRLEKIAQQLEKWELLADKFEEIATTLDGAFKIEILTKIAGIKELKLDNYSDALVVYSEIMKLKPADKVLSDSVMRLAAKTGSFAVGIYAMMLHIENSGNIDEHLIKMFEASASALDEWEKLAATFESSLAQSEVNGTLKSELYLRLAKWFMDYCKDKDKAISVLKKAVELSGTNIEALNMLSDIITVEESADYIKTQSDLYAFNSDNLDPLFKSAKCAMDYLDDYEEKRTIVLKLYESASKLWTLGREATGEYSPGDCVLEAVTKVAALDLENNNPRKAAGFLMEGAKLPFDNVRSLFMRNQAAVLFAENGLTAVAIDVYNQILSYDPDNTEILEKLDALLEKDGRTLELMAIRQKRLELSDDIDVKIKLRLDLAKLGGILEGSNARMQMLIENLNEIPGHKESLDSIVDLMMRRGVYNELVKLLISQAEQISKTENSDYAAKIYETAASIIKDKLHDEEMAVGVYQKVVEIKPVPSAIDELSKLLISRGDLASAAKWLKKRIDISEPQELTTTLLRLSRLLIKIGEEKEAVKTLEDAFEGAPKNAEVRKLLFEEYKKLGEQVKLAKALERSAETIKEPKTKLLYAKEAANLFINELNDYASAVTVLKIVNELDDEDFNYKIMLADSYLAVNAFDEAEVLLVKILEEFGRRRTPARAAVHSKLAGVLRAKGNMDEALENLELASKIDNHNIDISVSLARLAFEKGDLDLAERTYRALLMTVRREKDSSAKIGPSLILLELSWVAEVKEQQEKADELQQSALESLENDNSPLQVIEQRLIEKERFELLEKIYRKEIEKETRPVLIARIYLKLADIYNTHLNNIDAAFDAAITAVKEDAGNPVYHDMVERLANELDRFDQYESTVDDLLKITRRDDELLTKCELLLRSISIKIKKGENLEVAKEQFQLAESLGVREVDVMRTGSVLAGEMGDQSEQVRILEILSSMGASLSEADTHLDAMFTLSEIYMSSEDTFDEGLENLKTAFNESDNIERAGRILRKISSKIKDKDKIAPIFERIARSSKDSLLLLDYFKLLALTEQATPAAVKEGAMLAIEIEQMEDAYFLMETIVSLSERYPEYAEAISWAMLGLGERKNESQDMAGAVKFFMDAADIAGDENCFQFGLKIAETIASVNGDLLLASKVYERLLELQPGSNLAWEPLSDIYSKLGNIDGFECLVEESLYSIEDVASRNSLRLKWARLLLTLNDRTEDAIDVLKNILMDDPGHGEALSELSNYLISSGSIEDLLELLNDRFESSIERESKDEVRSLAVELIKHIDDSEKENIYRRALGVTGDDKDLLLGLFKVLDPEEDSAERISILERTLNSETGEDASKLSLKIADAYREMGDSESVSRTLKKGYELNPDDLELKEALIDDFKNNEDFRGLVTVLNDVALAIENPRDKKDLFLQVAEIYKTQLNDISGEIKSLINLSEISPDDFTVVDNLIDALIRGDKITDAEEKIAESLEVFENETERSSLLLHRIKIYKMTGDLDGAIADAEEIFSVNKELIEEELEQLLINQQEFCRTANDIECERVIVYKLAALYKGNDDSDKLVSILSDWLEKNDKDVDAWRELLDIFKKHEDWQMVVAACKKLTLLTEGDEQLLIAKILTDSCKEIGDLETARRGLEYVYKENIDGTSLRTDLKSVYEELGAYQELAVFHAHDAQAAKDEGERAELFRKAGESYLKAGDPDTALMALNESLALAPDNLDSAILVIDIEIENKNFETAKELIEKAIDSCKKKRSPQMAALQLRMSILFEKDGDKMEQLNWLEHASQSDRNDGDIIAQVAYLGMDLEQWDTALKALRTISLLKTPCIISKAESFFLQGKISHLQDDDKRAILYVKKAIQENKEYQEAIDFLAEIS